MSIKEAEEFYKQDKKEYLITQNTNFLKWLNNNYEEGYRIYISPEEMEKLIDFITNWYEMKYPEKELMYYEGIIASDVKNIPRISENMNFNQLLYRLSHDLVQLFKCDYRYSYSIDINYETGVVDKYFLEQMNIPSEKEITIDELLEKLDINDNETDIDYEEVETLVRDHNLDLELREKILSFAALKILYSKNTTPERGYERSKRFINEFNKKIPDLNLSMSTIDEIINRDYNVYSKPKQLLKRILKR